MEDSALVEQIAESTDRIANGVAKLTDRQRVSSEATNVFFHGRVPTSPSYVYFVSAGSTSTIRDLRFQNLGTSPATLSVFLVDWRQVTKQNEELEYPNLGIVASIETSDLIYRESIPAGAKLGESVHIAVPPLWILALRANGEINGHISGIEILTV